MISTTVALSASAPRRTEIKASNDIVFAFGRPDGKFQDITLDTAN